MCSEHHPGSDAQNHPTLRTLGAAFANFTLGADWFTTVVRHIVLVNLGSHSAWNLLHVRQWRTLNTLIGLRKCSRIDHTPT